MNQSYLNGHSPTVLSDGRHGQKEGMWVPDGRRLFFLGGAAAQTTHIFDDETGAVSLFVVPVAGGEPGQLTTRGSNQCGKNPGAVMLGFGQMAARGVPIWPRSAPPSGQ